jgi:hypothetical protein
VPFVILLLDRIFPRRVFQAICIALIFSSFISIGRSGIRPGPAVEEYRSRVKDLEFTRRVISSAEGLQAKSTVVAGWWLPKIQWALLDRRQDGARFVYLLDAPELQSLLAQGSAIYYLPGIRTYNARVFGVDLQKSGAKLLNVDVPDARSRGDWKSVSTDEPGLRRSARDYVKLP